MKFFDWFSVVMAVRTFEGRVAVVGRPRVVLNNETSRWVEQLLAEHPGAEILVAPVDASENVALVDRIHQRSRYD